MAAAVLWVGGIATFGLSVLLSPASLLLTAVAWRRSSRDAVFWIGFGLNAVLAVGLIGFLVALLTGDASVGFE